MKDSSTATERVGRYQLLEPIGSGPNGAVARAKVFGVAGFERQFAVKRFLPELTVGSAAQALSAAARSYGSLEHPRIARMSEFGVAQGQTFTAVELVNGLDVFRLLQEAKLAGVAIAPGGALALVSQAARAVGYAHGRGLSHLGLAPTNVIVTADGDVKVTDFGILAATMPKQPAEATRLASRVPYLAPEQIAGEATSAATDVFVLGVIAYELVTGQRAYHQDTPAAVAQAIVAGPPAEPALPRPIVRVLQRCLARSPFERFPDARALADALDAALRVAPVPGTRKDVGAQVKTTLERYAQLNEGNVSGMVALNMPASTPAVTPPAWSRPEARTEPSPMPVMPQSEPPPSPASTLREIPAIPATVPGVAPPPIPVPPGVAPPPGALPSVVPPTTQTIPGVSPVKKPQIPPIVPQIKKPAATATTPAIPPIAKPPPSSPSSLSPTAFAKSTPPAPTAMGSLASEGSPLVDTLASISDAEISIREDDVAATSPEPVTTPSLPQRQPKVTPGQNFESATGEMSAAQIEALNRRATLATSELLPAQRPPDDVEPAPAPPAPVEPTAATPSTPAAPEPAPASASTMPGVAPPPTSQPVAAPSAASPPARPGSVPARPMAPVSRSRLPLVAGVVLAIGVLGAGGVYAYRELVLKKQDEPAQIAARDPGATAETNAASDPGSAAAPTPPDTGSASAPTGSAGDADSATAGSGSDTAADPSGDASELQAGSGSAAAGSDDSAGADANGATAGSVVAPSAPSDAFEVVSTPKGARVFIDGADQGTTPVKVPRSSDRHTLAVLLPGHDLYVAEVDGQGVYNIELQPVTPSGGHAGIKVLRCKHKERYYVYVDGKPTGMTCPTERIDTVVGPHTVEVYDIVTETRRKWDIYVKDERLSFRVRID